MSLAYGPEAGTVGTVLEFDISPDTQDIQVRNDTPNDLFVLFGPAPQPAPGSAVQGANSTDGQWNNVVAAWDHPVLPVGNRGRFNGRVWLLPIDNGGLPNSGTRSVRNAIYVIAFEEGDHVPAGSSLPRQHDLTSQARVVSVPISMPGGVNGRVALSSGLTVFAATAVLTPAMLAAQAAQGYLYYVSLFLGGIGPNAITGWSINIEQYVGDALGGVLAGTTPNTIYLTDMLASNNNAAPFVVFSVPHIFAPPTPIRTATQWPSGAPTNLNMRLHITGGFGSATLDYNIGWFADGKNVASLPGPIGDGTAFLYNQGDPNVF